ncbi:MAG TPA: PHB depolymerase family esterase [Gemmatimonadota bacterium]|nr:PHB depolymerase family esterase [Gemmatimonadota bacterium]
MTASADSSAAVRECFRFAGLVLLLATVLVSGCESGTEDPIGPATDPVPGPGDFARSMVSGGLQRSYRLHVPPGWSPHAGFPLVLAFHGLQSSPDHLWAVSGLDDVADQSGVVVAYPAAAVGDWNTACLECGSNAVVEEIDDLGFVSDLVDRLATDAGIDRRRVYVIGISNGALFVHHLACTAQEMVAGAASIAATLIAPQHVPACDGGTVPIMFFHGSEDIFFPPEGGLAGNEVVNVRLLSIEESVATWADRDGCEGDRTSRRSSTWRTTGPPWSANSTTTATGLRPWSTTRSKAGDTHGPDPRRRAAVSWGERAARYLHPPWPSISPWTTPSEEVFRAALRLPRGSLPLRDRVR